MDDVHSEKKYMRNVVVVAYLKTALHNLPGKTKTNLVKETLLAGLLGLKTGSA
jgi:hypothetical protein